VQGTQGGKESCQRANTEAKLKCMRRGHTKGPGKGHPEPNSQSSNSSPSSSLGNSSPHKSPEYFLNIFFMFKIHPPIFLSLFLTNHSRQEYSIIHDTNHYLEEDGENQGIHWLKIGAVILYGKVVI
jgi:hypothetical protein